MYNIVLQLLATIKQLRLIMYMTRGLKCKQSPKNGAPNLDIISDMATDDNALAISTVVYFISFKMNGVNMEKFISANVAIDMPKIMFKNMLSRSRSKSKKAIAQCHMAVSRLGDFFGGSTVIGI